MPWTENLTFAFQEGAASSKMNLIGDNFDLTAPHLIARKTSDQNFPNTTHADVTSLVFPVLATEVRRFTVIVIYSAVAAADINLRWTFPTGGRLTAGLTGFDPNLASIYRQWDDTVSPGTGQPLGGSVTARIPITIEGVFITAGTAGNVQLQAAQNASDATPSVVYSNSTVWSMKLA